MKRFYMLGFILGGVFFWSTLYAVEKEESAIVPEDVAVLQEAVRTSSGLQKETVAQEKNNSLEVLVKKFLKSKKCYGCNLSGADFSGRNLNGADLEGANLSHCSFHNAKLKKANLKGADLSGANMQGADLRRADLYKANLSDVDLTGADLKETTFDDTVLHGVMGLNQQNVLLEEDS